MKGTIGERDDWFMARSVNGTTGVEGRLKNMIETIGTTGLRLRLVKIE